MNPNVFNLTDKSGNKLCLARTLIHETMHPILDLIPAGVYAGSVDAGLFNQSKPRYSASSTFGGYKFEERAITETLKCDLCK